ncbi:hypothetical protein M8C21_032313 [Ambrosia artemisiifolia]|uniref:Uncharacterized protein n=1 Tax=Ambrosia artemisiifolia TaxID=4212 RepID=A0AAD5CSN8_AMBAR|nr:hypothetical protein M8C21_032313 [Ambrosia artemisiifolia]
MHPPTQELIALSKKIALCSVSLNVLVICEILKYIKLGTKCLASSHLRNCWGRQIET